MKNMEISVSWFWARLICILFISSALVTVLWTTEEFLPYDEYLDYHPSLGFMLFGIITSFGLGIFVSTTSEEARTEKVLVAHPQAVNTESREIDSNTGHAVTTRHCFPTGC